MNVVENLFQTLSEECNEVGQRSSKANRFSTAEVQPGQALTNAQRVEEEIDDLFSVVEMLNEVGGLNYQPNRQRIEAKKGKILRFMRYSMTCGTLSDDEGLIRLLSNSLEERSGKETA